MFNNKKKKYIIKTNLFYYLKPLILNVYKMVCILNWYTVCL